MRLSRKLVEPDTAKIEGNFALHSNLPPPPFVQETEIDSTEKPGWAIEICAATASFLIYRA